ncbi:hypothetical protein [Rothia nasimurium]|uniref:hypothetical protein n=1 Tax=Rothia nasimurium TaxID=85336 RepID=UPI003B9F24AE
MHKKPLLLLSAAALALLTACGGSTQEATSDATTSASASATATPTPTAEATTETPTAEPTPEATETPAVEESPAEETPTEEATPAEPVENFPGEYITQDRVAYFVPESYVRDETPSQPEIFVHQYTHYTTGDEALGRLMVGTPFTSPDGRSAEELEKEAVERLKPAWKINETVNTTSYTRPDGVKVIRSEVRFASGNNPGYIYTIDNGVELLHAAILIEQSDSTEFLEKIENSIGIVQ